MIENFEDIKAGDKVIVHHGGVYRWDEVRTVDRVTNTQIVIGTLKFRKNDGMLVGRGIWDAVFLNRLTKEKEKEIALGVLRNEIKRKLVDLEKRIDALTEEQLNEINDCLTKY